MSEELVKLAAIGKLKAAVVKVCTSYYNTGRGFAVTKRIEFLKRKSDAESIYSIREDALYGSVESVIERIVNLNEVKDGLHQMIHINERRDWESGSVDDWDYKLVPYKEAKP